MCNSNPIAVFAFPPIFESPVLNELHVQLQSNSWHHFNLIFNSFSSIHFHQFVCAASFALLHLHHFTSTWNGINHCHLFFPPNNGSAPQSSSCSTPSANSDLSKNYPSTVNAKEKKNVERYGQSYTKMYWLPHVHIIIDRSAQCAFLFVGTCPGKGGKLKCNQHV